MSDLMLPDEWRDLSPEDLDKAIDEERRQMGLGPFRKDKQGSRLVEDTKKRVKKTLKKE